MTVRAISVKGEKLRFLAHDDEAEQLITGSATGETPTTWNLKVKGTYLHWVDNDGNERRKEGTLTGEARDFGSITVHGEQLYYGDESDAERYLSTGGSEILRPNADTAFLGLYIFPNTGESHFQDVDEVVSDEDATYLYWESGAVSSSSDYFDFPDSSIGSGTILSVEIHAMVKCTPVGAGNETVTLTYWNIEGSGWSSNIQIARTGFYTEISWSMTTNPVTDLPWTWTEINEMRIGITLRVSYPPTEKTYCTQLWVVVNYS